METPMDGLSWGPFFLQAIDAMGLMYLLLVDPEEGTITIQMEANSRAGALLNPEPGEQTG
jgi:hypothetical protein